MLQVSSMSVVTRDAVLTVAPYASKIRPVGRLPAKRKKSWRDPIKEMDADEEDGRRVDS